MRRFLTGLLLALVSILAAVPTLAANPVVEMQTSEGTILIELYPEQAPKTVENFLEYVKSGFYNGTIFHRVIDGFMIQGGGFTSYMQEKPTGAPIPNEAKNGLKNAVGTIAMARTSNPHSATAQFFINLVDNRSLDYPSFDGWGYAVFGKVTKGMDVVAKIGKVETTRAGAYQNVPVKSVIVQTARIVAEPAGK